MKYVFLSMACLCLIVNSCNNSKEKSLMNNPLLQAWNTPYEVPPFEQIKPEHYLPAIEEAMRQHNAEIENITSQKEEPTFVNTVEALEYSGQLLDKISAVFFNILETNNSDQMQKIADAITPGLSNHSDSINMNTALFERIDKVFKNKEKYSLTDEQNRLLEETYKGFIRGGAGLVADKQKRFKAVNEQIAILALKFNKNVLDATHAYRLVIDNEAELSGLPESVRAAAAQAADSSQQGKWIFTLDNPSLLPFLQYADNRQKREEIWRAYSSRCNEGKFDNNAIIKQLIQLRIERAQLLGYHTHADFVLEENMAKTPQAVYDLLKAVWKPALEKVKQERDLYRKHAGKESLQPWDWRYYTERIRKQQYDLNEDSIRPYFAVENVRDAAFMVSEKLYGLTFKANPSIPVYDQDVVVYEVMENQNVIAILYMDFYARPSKGSGAWMTEFRTQCQTKDGKDVIPVISLVFNFPAPLKDKPSLLNFDETETLFHEFGHALHGMLSKCRYASLAGTNVARDFVELPSQFMENWAKDKQVMKMYAKHYLTKEPISDALIVQIEKSSQYGQGFINAEIIAASLLDMDYHTISAMDAHFDPVLFEQADMNQYGLIPEVLPRYKSQYFKHIFASQTGYSAGYYAYTWSAVLEADAFEVFKEKGIFDKDAARLFRTCILETGNTSDLMKQYVAFRGKEPDIKPLLKKRGLFESDKQ
jgi:peptidyl-dipeptidase Dcp